jgi:hypothetical protein
VFDRVGLTEEKCRGARVASKSIKNIKAILANDNDGISLERAQPSNDDNTYRPSSSLAPVLDTIDGKSQMRRSSKESTTSDRPSLWMERSRKNEDRPTTKNYSEYREDPDWEMDHSSIVDSRDEDSI